MNTAKLEVALRGIQNQPYGNREAHYYHFTASYGGHLYGRLGKAPTPYEGGMADLWPGYFIQGYYPYFFHETNNPFFHTMRNALMWDVGSYVFHVWVGRRSDGMPHANEGCHDSGGNFLLR